MDSNASHPLIDQLRPIFTELQSTKAETLPSVLLKLDYVIEEERDALFHRGALKSSVNNTKALPLWINQQLRDLFSQPATQLAGVRALRSLITVDYMELNEMTKLFSELLVRCVLETNDYAVGLEAAEVWGLLLNNGSSVVEGIITNCLNFSVMLLLRDGHDVAFLEKNTLHNSDFASHVGGASTDSQDYPQTTKLSGGLLINQLVRSVPSTTVPFLNSILEGLRRAIIDRSPLVCVSAASALSNTLHISYRSADPSFCRKWQDTLLNDVLNGLHYGSPVILHGVFLMFNAVLSSVTEREAGERMMELSAGSVRIVQQVWAFVNQQLTESCHGSELRKVLLNTMTPLAKYDRAQFKETTVPCLMKLCHSVFTSTEGSYDERPLLFLTLGRLLLVMPEMVAASLERLMAHIEVSLVKRPNRDRCLEAVSCFAMLSEAEPNVVRPFLRRILGPLFAGNITEGFAKDVAKLCAVFPELRSTCLSKMLEATKLQLQATRLRPGQATGDGAPRFILEHLNALRSLDFTGYSTLKFLCDAVIRFVSDPHEDVRRSAIDLCLKLVLSGCSQSPCERTDTGVVIHHGREHMRLINAVMKKLVNAAVADSVSDIRLHTLGRLTAEYDYTLALQDIVRSLFPALYDKHQNRIVAVRLLGRISRRNRACIYPMLRRVMVQCVADIQHFRLPKKQEQATWVLSTVVESAPDMVRPYVSSLLHDCVCRLKGSSQPVSVQTALLSCVGKLARYAEGADVAEVAAIRPTVIGHILDSSNILKKQEAIRALGDIIRTTKDVDVYEEHPELLNVLLSALHGGFKETWPVRLDVLKLMGIIGAVDPARVKEITRRLRDNGAGANGVDGVHPGGANRSEDAIAVNVVRNVLNILQLPSLTEDQCICGVEVIANTLSLRESIGNCLVPYYSEIINVVLRHTCQQPKIRECLLGLLTRIVNMYGQHLRQHLDGLLATVTSFLPSADRSVLVEVLRLMVEIRHSLCEEFRPHLSNLLPPIVDTVQADPSRAGKPIFAFFIEMGSLMDSYLHSVLPCICDIACNSSYSLACRTSAVDAIRHFAKRLPRLAFHASRTIHCLCRILKEMQVQFNGVTSSRSAAVETLVTVTLDAVRDVARNLGSDGAKYIPMVCPVLEMYGRKGLDVKNFLTASAQMAGCILRADVTPPSEDATGHCPVSYPTHRRRAGEDPFASLRNVLVTRDCDTEEEWSMWLKHLSVELLRSSPALAHGFAFPLAQIHEPFARHMLHSAFAVCMCEMDGGTREKVVKLLGTVLREERVPSEVLQELLNLSEYMERLEMRFDPKEPTHRVYSTLLFDLKTLIGSSERCNLHAKALHYVEIQFNETTYEYERSVMRGHPRPLPPEEWRSLMQLCEKSIYLCNLLGQRESAEGMLKYIQLNFSLLTGRPASELPRMMGAQLFEKLQWWSQSLKAYQQGLQQEPNKLSNMVGLMRSLDNLGDCGQLLESWRVFSSRVSKKEASELAPYGAHAAWLLRCWDEMERITEYMSDEGYLGTTAVFYRAVLAIHRRQFHDAELIIQLCRKRLDSTLSALVAESYDRAYGLIVGIQQLSELEEFAFVADNPQGLNHWQELWEKRLGAMAYEGWSGTLANHALVIPPQRELDMWLSFVSLSRLNGRERTSSEILYELLGSQTITNALQQTELPLPAIALASFQHLYDTQERDRAIELLDCYLTKLEAAAESKVPGVDGWHESLAVCHSKLAGWIFAQPQKRGTEGYHRSIECVLKHLERATTLDGKNGSIWHTWARFNHSLVSKSHNADMKREQFIEYIVCAMDGYIRSVCLSQELEDVLSFLSLWFSHASLPQVQNNATLQAEVLQVSPRVWLKVIPQIIARIHSKDAVVSESVYHLLVVIAKSHPQALLYSLNVSNVSVPGTTAEQMERKHAAQRILTRIVELHHQGRVLVSDAALVCQELVRCAVLWTELWFDELERAWHQWGRDKNAQNVLASLQPLLDQLKCPETMAESHFVAEFGDFLFGACDFVQKATSLGNPIYMEDAWNRFKTAVKRMDEQINNMSSLALQLVSPRLVQSGRNLSLVVPGQYHESGQYPRIASFHNTLKVINSKQHPRRLYVNGTDGELYKFLLKGHEDLRLDERVTQLLAFVNTLLEKHSHVQRRDGMIQVYSVTPLSDNAGLVGWVDHCDTLHQLIKEYRVHSKYLSIEINLMLSYGVDLDRLTAIQHVEPFEYALEQTEGTDLANSLWMRAPSAESWLDRRTTYVCSLATMSMVGHILGLGDRHPSNLMVHSFSGRIVHIDFGDCFDVARQRSAFPEKVPFRLTRMLVKAMEVSGIEGLFRHGCISVMSVLREEGSSILALLEAFVHDPLVSWWRDDVDCESPTPPVTSNPMSPMSTAAVHHNAAYSSLGESFQQRNTSDYCVGSFQTRSSRPRAEVMSVSEPLMTDPHAGRSQSNLSLIKSARIQGQVSKAQKVVNRIREKLEGREFPQLLQSGRSRHAGADLGEGMTVEGQVTRLIEEATANGNLCQHFQGWCPFW